MCKHILFNQFNPKTDIKTLEDFADKTHDRDGFGAVLRLPGGEIITLKSLSLAGFYRELGEILATSTPETLVVHHRTSTNKGGLDYAHPFEFQGVFLTHNGVVSVPGNHETKTENDSEALLHHLIKTGFDTVSIKGYFSVFMVSAYSTRIIVDETAPIFTDNRVFSSHKMGETWKKITKKMILIENGKTKTSKIELGVSDYGFEKRGLSLGETYSEIPGGFYLPEVSELSRDAEDFLYFLDYDPDQNTDPIWETRSNFGEKREVELRNKILEKAHFFGLKLSKKTVQELVEYFI